METWKAEGEGLGDKRFRFRQRLERVMMRGTCQQFELRVKFEFTQQQCGKEPFETMPRASPVCNLNPHMRQETALSFFPNKVHHLPFSRAV
jgi:hypothetical protein